MPAKSMICVWLLLFAPGWAADTAFPTEFGSTDEARAWTQGLFAGGSVTEVKTGRSRQLIVFQHGSGVPVVRIGLYRRKFFHWRLVAQTPPPAGSGEFLRASVVDGKIILIGESSGRTWPLPASD